MRVSLFKTFPFFSLAKGLIFLVDLRVVLEQIFICIEEISVLHSEIQISLFLRQILKLK